MKETLKHKEAFEYYYSLGAGRNLPSVAVQCGVSEKSVATWSKTFDWQARIEQRDMENAKRLQKATDDTVVAVKARYRKIVQTAIGDFVKRMKEGEVKVISIMDLERLIKLDLLLMGEATESHAHKFEEMFGIGTLNDDELQERLTEASHRLALGSLPPSA
jgi:hypothetical protein